MENNASKRKPNIVDVMIVILLILCICGIALRFLLIKSTPDPDTLPDIETEKYYVTYLIRDQRYSMLEYLAEGEEFRFYTTNKPFGVSTGTRHENALKRYTTTDGDEVTVYNMATEERAQRYDIWGTILVEGKLTADGCLVINGSASKTIGVNSDVQIRSDRAYAKVYVIDITPAE